MLNSRHLIIFILACSSSGCAYHYNGGYETVRGAYIDPSLYENLVVGESNRQEVISRFGKQVTEEPSSGYLKTLSSVSLRCKKNLKSGLFLKEEYYSSIENSYRFEFDEKDYLVKKESSVKVDEHIELCKQSLSEQ